MAFISRINPLNRDTHKRFIATLHTELGNKIEAPVISMYDEMAIIIDDFDSGILHITKEQAMKFFGLVEAPVAVAADSREAIFDGVTQADFEEWSDQADAERLAETLEYALDHCHKVTGIERPVKTESAGSCSLADILGLPTFPLIQPTEAITEPHQLTRQEKDKLMFDMVDEMGLHLERHMGEVFLVQP